MNGDFKISKYHFAENNHCNLLLWKHSFIEFGKRAVDLELVNKDLGLLLSSDCVTLGNSPSLSVS